MIGEDDGPDLDPPAAPTATAAAAPAVRAVDELPLVTGLAPPEAEAEAEAVADDLVPAAFAVAVPRRDPDEPLRPHSFEALHGQEVLVDAGGFTYRGHLVGADEDDVYLRGEARWWVLPLMSVREVRLAPPEPPLRSPKPGFDEAAQAAIDERDDASGEEPVTLEPVTLEPVTLGDAIVAPVTLEGGGGELVVPLFRDGPDDEPEGGGP